MTTNMITTEDTKGTPPYAKAAPELIGPFATFDEAVDWAMLQTRWLVHVLPLLSEAQL